MFCFVLFLKQKIKKNQRENIETESAMIHNSTFYQKKPFCRDLPTVQRLIRLFRLPEPMRPPKVFSK